MIWKTIKSGTKAWLWSLVLCLIVPLIFWAGNADIYVRGPTLALMLGITIFIFFIARLFFNAAGWDRD